MTNSKMKHFQDLCNIMLATDSYKASHWNMLPEGLSYTSSYCESRGGAFPFTLFFGLQYYIESYLVGVQVTEEKIQEAVQFYKEHFGLDNVFNEKGWRYILENCGGKLPIKIEAVKEGSIIPTKNCLFKISNTDPNCAWLVNWCETLLMKMWYPITVGTNSMAGRELLNIQMAKTGTSNMQHFMLHDFGYRGVASEEQAWLGGAAHLLSFKGTDNVAGVRMLQHYYGAPMCGFSVNASEHMVMTVRGRDKEKETYKALLTKFKDGTLSLVSDQYDIYEVCRFLASDPELKQLVLDRNGRFVIRPDSGEPREVLEKCLEILAEGFGYTTNEKGYKVINSKLGLLQGDGITIYTMYEILEYLGTKGWSIDNFVFGSGGGLLQKYDRDTMQFAIKCSYAIIDGVAVDVYKDPITSKGSKKSKKGLLFTIWDAETGYSTVNEHELDNHKWATQMLHPVFENGNQSNIQTLDTIVETMTIDNKRIDDLIAKQPKAEPAL